MNAENITKAGTIGITDESSLPHFDATVIARADQQCLGCLAHCQVSHPVGVLHLHQTSWDRSA